MRLVETVFDEPNYPRSYFLDSNETEFFLRKGNRNGDRVDISFENLRTLMTEISLNKGIITANLVYIENDVGVLELVTAGGSKFKEAEKNSKLKLADISVGDKVLFLNDDELIYVGRFYKNTLANYNLERFEQNRLLAFINPETRRVSYLKKSTPLMRRVISHHPEFACEEENLNMLKREEHSRLADYKSSYEISIFSVIKLSKEELTERGNR